MLKRALFSIVLFSTIIMAGLVFTTQPTYACDPVPGDGGFAEDIFPPWYKYLDGVEDSEGVCRVDVTNANPARTATLILIAIIELLTRLAALVAVGFVIYGAIQYIVSQGDSQSLSNAKSTIANALIGLIITLLSVALIQFIGRIFAVK